jgi:D-alanine-D-alanine ligase-like ATP-grasp enzyme
MKKLLKHKKESLVLGALLQKIAPSIGASVLLEPHWGIVGQVTFKSGRKSYFRYNTLDLNPVGSSDVAKDKDYANFFMEKMGYPTVPKSKTFFSESWARAINAEKRSIDDAYLYAHAIGFPVVVKPNSGSCGNNVAFVYTKREFYTALRRIFKRDRVALVQHPVKGKDYRLVVLDAEVISAYERQPLGVLGNGRQTIAQLLASKQDEFKRHNRDTQISSDDPRILLKLARRGMTLDSVPKNGEHITLLDNANLSTGGDSVDVTGKVHQHFEKLAVQLTKDMGLRLCGVDLMIDGDIHDGSSPYVILEINAAPGLDHYARSGAQQKKIVEALYLKVLHHLDV